MILSHTSLPSPQPLRISKNIRSKPMSPHAAEADCYDANLTINPKQCLRFIAINN